MLNIPQGLERGSQFKEKIQDAGLKEHRNGRSSSLNSSLAK